MSILCGACYGMGYVVTGMLTKTAAIWSICHECEGKGQINAVD